VRRYLAQIGVSLLLAVGSGAGIALADAALVVGPVATPKPEQSSLPELENQYQQYQAPAVVGGTGTRTGTGRNAQVKGDKLKNPRGVNPAVGGRAAPSDVKTGQPGVKTDGNGLDNSKGTDNKTTPSGNVNTGNAPGTPGKPAGTGPQGGAPGSQGKFNQPDRTTNTNNTNVDEKTTQPGTVTPSLVNPAVQPASPESKPTPVAEPVKGRMIPADDVIVTTIIPLAVAAQTSKPVIPLEPASQEPTAPTGPLTGLLFGLRNVMYGVFAPLPTTFNAVEQLISSTPPVLFILLSAFVLIATSVVMPVHWYTRRLKQSGYLGAPRSDVPALQLSFATPLKWALSACALPT
jgi:hypothetical protein